MPTMQVVHDWLRGRRSGGGADCRAPGAAGHAHVPADHRRPLAGGLRLPGANPQGSQKRGIRYDIATACPSSTIHAIDATIKRDRAIFAGQ